MSRRPLSLAIGLMRLPPLATSDQHTRTRIALALLAADHGYTLLETYPTDGTPTDLATTLTRIEDLTRTLDLDALAVAGDPDHATVEEFAARARLLVLRLPPQDIQELPADDDPRPTPHQDPTPQNPHPQDPPPGPPGARP